MTSLYTRRQFLRFLLGGTATVALNAAGLRVVTADRQLAQSVSVISTLTSVVETLFAERSYPVDLSRYTALFTYKSERYGLYRDVYAAFAETLDTQTMAMIGQPFAASDLATRRAVLAPAADHLDDCSEGSDDAPYGWNSFGCLIFDEVLTLFFRTDAWFALGYEGYPGMAKGLESYLQPAPGASVDA